MLEFTVFFFIASLLQVLGSPVWKDGPLQSCPKASPQENLQLNQVVGSWRLAYLFLSQEDQGIEEEDSCVVLDLISLNKTDMELSLFIDAARADHVDRTTAQFPATMSSPAEWKIHAPLTAGGFLEAKVIQASADHLVVTFCGLDYSSEEEEEDNADEKRKPTSAEAMPDWRSLFEAKRRKRSFDPEDFQTVGDNFLPPTSPSLVHMWTTVLVKHNNISALKFVEYATVLMRHGFDVTKGELISFGKCPVTLNKPRGKV